MEPETYYARSGGLRIAYQVTGEGPDLVMVPGLTSHLEIQWRDLKYRRFVRSLSSFCRLVRFDKPGTGLSDPVAKPPTLDERVADLVAVVSASRCRRPVVLGYSDRGPVAVALAATHRRLVRALILYGTSPRRPPAGVIAERLRGTAALATFFRMSSGPGWALVGDAGHHKDPVIARGIADAFRDADLVASAVAAGWHDDLEAALAEYGRQRDRCAIPLSDANLGIARLDMAAEALGDAWFHMTGLEQALDDPAAVSD